MKRSLRSLFLTLVTVVFASTTPLYTIALTAPPAWTQTNKEQLDAAQKLLETGVQQYGASQFALAEETFLQALKIYQRLNNQPGQWFALHFLGVMYSSNRNFVKANDYHNQSLKLAEQMSDRAKQVDALNGLGQTALLSGDTTQALNYYQQSLKLAKATSDQYREVKTLEGLSDVYITLGDDAKARGYQQQREALLAQSGQGTPNSNPQEQIMQLVKQAQQLDERGTTQALQEAVKHYETALTLARKSNNRTLESITLLGLGVTTSRLGQRQQAITHLTQALQMVRSLDGSPPKFEVAILLALGRIHSDLGDKRKALTFYDEALRLQKPLDDKSAEGTLLNNIGKVYIDLSEYQKGLDYFNQGLASSTAAGDRSAIGKTLNNIGLTYANLGLYQRALEQYEQALALFQAIKQPFDQATTLNNIGTVYGYLGQRPKALKYFNQALALVKDTSDRAQQSVTIANIGWIYSYDDSRKAIESYNQALTLVRELSDPQREAVILGNLGQEYATAGDYVQAQRIFASMRQIAEKIGDRAQHAFALACLGQVSHLQKSYANAVQQFQQALALAQPLGDRRLEGYIHLSLARALLASKQPAAAEPSILKAITVWETIRADLGNNDANKVSLFEEYARAYRLLQAARVAQNKPEAALEAAERGRARAFVDLLAGRLQTQERLTGEPPLTIQQIRQLAKDENATLVEYSILQEDLTPFQPQKTQETTLLIWVIKPDGSITMRQTDLRPGQPKLPSLEALLAQTREAIGRQQSLILGQANTRGATAPRSRAIAPLQQLHQLLIQPIADLLPTNPDARVVFMPQGSLFLVPFAALQDASGIYLIQKHTILTAPSIQVLNLTRQTQASRSTTATNAPALIVGNPTMPKIPLVPGEPPQQLSDLPWTEEEAKVIASLLKTEAITGDRASKTAVLQKMPAARLIHLATHGLIDDFKGMGVPGAIALAPDPVNAQANRTTANGILTADEILDLKLNAELVVLSACDTAQGRITGDGVIGLSRSFISAGVPSLVVSLWAVPDDSTMFLMAEFYQNLQQQPDKANALRRAMLTTLQRYPSPRDWAAFTLIGKAEFGKLVP
ncbi:MAG: CHAT domain-containing protein [Oscillatoriales cyanobacterium C42_A2020_001]|nr:CHAT domain-containing protein [Leptolyngbyaceae cyanobacterium C42_A2020_001]